MQRALKCGDRTLLLGTKTHVMGILNVTPDSFSDGGLYLSLEIAISRAQEMLDEGADVIDIGGESTRPYARPITPDEERQRIIPLVKALAKRGICNLSIDTRNAETARQAIEEGASWINDISSMLHDPHMADVAKMADALILMHGRNALGVREINGNQDGDVVEGVRRYLEERCRCAVEHGVGIDRILIDPGIGYGKRLEHNLLLTKRLSELRGIGAGLLYAGSRKLFLGEVTQVTNAKDRGPASLAVATFAAMAGADFVRVHEVKETVEALKVVAAVQNAAERNL
jgi:dihydropteroate synthase